MGRIETRHTIEVILIGYACGVLMMPGANMQFQFWFASLVPLLIDMVGLPQILTFWIYSSLYPLINCGDPSLQHKFMLCLLAWLVTIGPHKNIFESISSLFPSTQKSGSSKKLKKN